MAWIRPLFFGLVMSTLCACSVVKFNRAQVRSDYAQLSVRAHDADLPFGRLHYYDGGAGSPVLLIHGFAFGALVT